MESQFERGTGTAGPGGWRNPNSVPLPKMALQHEPSMSEQKSSPLAQSLSNSHVLNRVFGGKFAQYQVDKVTTHNFLIK